MILGRIPHIMKTRTILTLEKRKEVVKFKEDNPGASLRRIAAVFGVSKSQISDILRRKDDISKATALHDFSMTCRKQYKTKYDIVHKAVYSWYISLENTTVPLSNMAIKEKARQMCKDLAEETGQTELLELKISDGWLRHFKKRYGLQLVDGANEAADIVLPKQELPSVTNNDTDSNIVENPVDFGEYTGVYPYPLTTSD